MYTFIPQQVESTAFRSLEFGQAAIATWNAQATAVKPDSIRLKEAASKGKRWGVILAGGDGTRLRSLTRVISGDDRPKQFCPILGQHTLLEESQYRAARSITTEQTVLAVTRTHERFYLREPGKAPYRRLVQPCNRGTAPPILLSLLYISRHDKDAIVAVLPCDHYYSNEASFTRSLESAFKIAGDRPKSVVILGAQPNGPEVEFGWIEVGAPAAEGLFHVQGFQEKPTRDVAKRLFESGALWNTFVMVGHVQAFLQMAWAAAPEILGSLEGILPAGLLSKEIHVPAAFYEAIPISDFSRQILSPGAKQLLALRFNDMEWHDLGHPDRVVSVLRSRNDEFPPWMRRWEVLNRARVSPVA